MGEECSSRSVEKDCYYQAQRNPESSDRILLTRFLRKFNFSFFPGLSLGEYACEAENRFNGLHGNIEDFGAASETVKTVAEIPLPALTPGFCLGRMRS